MFFSKEFTKVVKNVNESKSANRVSILLQTIINEDHETVDINFIDCEKDMDDKISFITDKKLNKLYVDSSEDNMKSFIKKIKSDKDFWSHESRTKIKIGRFVRKIIENTYLNKLGTVFTDAEIESFVNNFKGFLGLRRNKCKFEVVKGEEIKKWYLHNNYQNTKGQLGASCMRLKKCQEFFDIYTENPKICKLLILRSDNDENKIKGRALLWKTSDGDLYLDRVYTNNDSDIVLFNEYAKRELGCKSTYDDVYSPNGEYAELCVKPTKTDFEKYPYMDTFRFFYKDEKEFWSEPVDKYDIDPYELEMTNGLLYED